jgi:hypothetical protein
MTSLTQDDRKRLRRQHHMEQVSMELAETHRQKAELAEVAGDLCKAKFHRKQQKAAERNAGA